MEGKTEAVLSRAGNSLFKSNERATSNKHRKEITVVGHSDDKCRPQGTGYGHRSRPLKFATVVIPKTKESKTELNIRGRRVRVGPRKGWVKSDRNRTRTKQE